MSLLTILVVLVVAGFLLWAIDTFIPMNKSVATLLRVIVIGVLLVWVLKALGVVAYLSRVHL